MDVDVELQPPGLDDLEDGDDVEVDVYVSVVESDGPRRSGAATVPGQPSDDELADALIAALRGAAACRGPGLAEALNRRLVAA